MNRHNSMQTSTQNSLLNPLQNSPNSLQNTISLQNTLHNSLQSIQNSNHSSKNNKFLSSTSKTSSSSSSPPPSKNLQANICGYIDEYERQKLIDFKSKIESFIADYEQKSGLETLELKRELAEKSKEILTLKIENLSLKKQLKENEIEREHDREMREREQLRVVESKKEREVERGMQRELEMKMVIANDKNKIVTEIEAIVEAAPILENSENCSPIINSSIPSTNTISDILKNFQSATAASKQQFEIEDEDEFDEDEELDEDEEEGNYMDFGMLKNLFAQQGQNSNLSAQNGLNSGFTGSTGQMLTPNSLASTLGLTSPGNSPLLDPANINFGGFNINHPAFRFPRKRGRPKKFGSNEPLPPPKRRSRIHENQVQQKYANGICPVCDSMLKSSSHLDIHMRKHVNAKPFKCPKCDYRSVQKGNLKQHIERHHTELLLTDNGQVQWHSILNNPETGIWGDGKVTKWNRYLAEAIKECMLEVQQARNTVSLKDFLGLGRDMKLARGERVESIDICFHDLLEQEKMVRENPLAAGYGLPGILFQNGIQNGNSGDQAGLNAFNLNPINFVSSTSALKTPSLSSSNVQSTNFGLKSPQSASSLNLGLISSLKSTGNFLGKNVENANLQSFMEQIMLNGKLDNKEVMSMIESDGSRKESLEIFGNQETTNKGVADQVLENENSDNQSVHNQIFKTNNLDNRSDTHFDNQIKEVANQESSNNLENHSENQDSDLPENSSLVISENGDVQKI